MNEVQDYHTPVTPAATPAASGLPEGWIAQWSHDHNAWYYLNTYTQESVWQAPSSPAQPSSYSNPASPPPSTYGQPYNQNQQAGAASGYFEQAQPETASYQHPGSPPPNDTEYQNHGVSGQPAPGAEASPGEGVEGDRGLLGTVGKAAMGVGAGALLAGFLGHQAKHHTHFNFSFPQATPQQPQQSHHGSFFGGLGGLSSGLATAWSGNNNNTSPPPAQPVPPQQPGPPPQSFPQQSNPGFFSGLSNPLPYNGPQLTIWSANYGSGDCTEKVRARVTPQQTLDLTDNGDPGVYDKLFGDHWGGNAKSLCILYQYSGRPLELLVTCQNGGNPVIRPDESIRPDRRAFITECGPVIAVVWGIMEGRDRPIAPNIIQDIASYKVFNATDDYFGFDGWAKASKTCVVFLNRDGRIYNIAVRERGTGRI